MIKFLPYNSPTELDFENLAISLAEHSVSPITGETIVTEHFLNSMANKKATKLYRVLDLTVLPIAGALSDNLDSPYVVVEENNDAFLTNIVLNSMMMTKESADYASDFLKYGVVLYTSDALNIQASLSFSLLDYVVKDLVTAGMRFEGFLNRCVRQKYVDDPIATELADKLTKIENAYFQFNRDDLYSLLTAPNFSLKFYLGVSLNDRFTVLCDISDFTVAKTANNNIKTYTSMGQVITYSLVR